MKKLFLILISIFSYSSISAQEIPIDIVERANAVDYIFEGEVISSEPYFTNNGQYIQTSNTVNITKRLKGNLQCGTIEVITIGGTVNSTTMEVSHSLELELGSKGIFLMDDSNREVSTIDFYPETNPEVLEGTYENQSFIRYWWNGQGINASDLWNNYDSLEQVYNSTEAVTGLNFIDCSASAIGVGDENTSTSEIVDEEVIFPTYSQETFDSLIEYANFKKRYYRRNDRANDKIFYNIENAIVTGTTTKYFEFDVTVKDDYGFGYLDLSAVRIQYDDQVFGNNVVSNTNIIVTRGTLNADSNCYSAPSPSDEANGNTVLISALETVYSQCKAPITAVAQSIMHVKMEFLNCNIVSDIALVDTATFFSPSLIQAYSAYSDFPADTFSTEYDFVEHIQVKRVPACKATITDFYPKEIAGGIGEVLTIEGFQFGATRGSGNVFFKNADDAGLSEIYLDDLDFISWSDTLIKIDMPSHDTSLVPGGASTAQPAGTGYFKLFSDDGTFDISPEPIKVKYSVVNYETKDNVVIAPWSPFNQEIVWQLDTAVANYDGGKMKAVIDKAIRDWKCMTGINWRLGNDTAYTHTLPLTDSLYLISFGALAPNVTANTSNKLAICGNDFVALESDIRLNVNDLWFCDTSGLSVPSNMESLYSIILHELGHAHMLKHVIDTDALMHYALPTGSLGVINLPLDASANQGGNWVMDYTVSQNSIVTCGATDNVLRVGNPCQQLSISEFENSNSAHKLYPNPFSNKLNIDLFSNETTLVNISILDVSGRTVKFLEQNITVGNNTFEIELDELPLGLYLINMKSTDGIINMSSKIVKDEK